MCNIYPPIKRGIITKNKYKNHQFKHYSPLSFQNIRCIHTSNNIQKVNQNNLSKKVINNWSIYWEEYWDNLDNPVVRDQIRYELKNKSGIYMIINTVSNNFYIGSAKTGNLYFRLHQHLFTFNNGNPYLKNAVLKYGTSNFIFAILDYINYISDEKSKKELLGIELSYFNILNPKYNILTNTAQFNNYKYETLPVTKNIEFLNATLDEKMKIKLNLIKEESNITFKKDRSKWRNIIKHNRSYNINKNGLDNINWGNSKLLYLWKYSIKNDKYLCVFNNLTIAAKYLKCSQKTISRAIEVGYIYVPNVFLPYLNQEHIDNNYDILSDIDWEAIRQDYRYVKNKYKYYKLKSGLVHYRPFTKIYLSSDLARHVYTNHFSYQ